MANNLKDKVADVGSSVAETAKNVGNKIADGASQAGDWVKDKVGMGPASSIQERMSVYASCGKKVGVVDRIEGKAIKLTRNDSPDGQHHYIPVDWVDHVDQDVHLKINSVETEQTWKSDAASCGCG